jgi:hypothetical protein
VEADAGKGIVDFDRVGGVSIFTLEAVIAKKRVAKGDDTAM